MVNPLSAASASSASTVPARTERDAKASTAAGRKDRVIGDRVELSSDAQLRAGLKSVAPGKLAAALDQGHKDMLAATGALADRLAAGRGQTVSAKAGADVSEAVRASVVEVLNQPNPALAKDKTGKTASFLERVIARLLPSS